MDIWLGWNGWKKQKGCEKYMNKKGQWYKIWQTWLVMFLVVALVLSLLPKGTIPIGFTIGGEAEAGEGSVEGEITAGVDVTLAQAPVAQSEISSPQTGFQTEACPFPKFPIGKVNDPLVFDIKNADDTKASIDNLTVEILKDGVDASDPNRLKVDTALTSGGVVEFTGNKVKTTDAYQLAVRGDSQIYDRLVKFNAPCLPPEVR
ncbi:MAG: hypothetical protein ACTSRU_17010, partial [Candidatus Hodarchaeales archaeon]